MGHNNGEIKPVTTIFCINLQYVLLQNISALKNQAI